MDVTVASQFTASEPELARTRLLASWRRLSCNSCTGLTPGAGGANESSQSSRPSALASCTNDRTLPPLPLSIRTTVVRSTFARRASSDCVTLWRRRSSRISLPSRFSHSSAVRRNKFVIMHHKLQLSELMSQYYIIRWHPRMKQRWACSWPEPTPASHPKTTRPRLRSVHAHVYGHVLPGVADLVDP